MEMDLRRFLRSPGFVIATLVLPLAMALVIACVAYEFGDKVGYGKGYEAGLAGGVKTKAIP